MPNPYGDLGNLDRRNAVILEYGVWLHVMNLLYRLAPQDSLASRAIEDIARQINNR
jgi:hypothetical protein